MNILQVSLVHYWSLEQLNIIHCLIFLVEALTHLRNCCCICCTTDSKILFGPEFEVDYDELFDTSLFTYPSVGLWVRWSVVIAFFTNGIKIWFWSVETMPAIIIKKIISFLESLMEAVPLSLSHVCIALIDHLRRAC